MPHPGFAAALLRSERRIALAALGGLAACALGVEAYLTHRMYAYFAGPTHNAPLGIVGPGAKLAYVAEALLYDVAFYGTLAALLLALGRRLRLSPLQRLYAAFATCAILFAGVVLAKWELFKYFAAKFDVAILLDLSAGKLTNAAIWLDKGTLTGLAVACTVPVAALLPVRLLRGRAAGIAAWQPTRRLALGLAALWALVLANTFAIIPFESLRFGLANKTSFWLVENGLEAVTDFDGDGFGPFTVPRDSDNWNAGIHPYALDIPGDGIDQDNLAGDLAALDPVVRQPPYPPLAPGKAPKNVIVAVIETFRMDAAEDPQAMPFLTALARRHALVPAYSNYGVTSRAIQTVLFGSIHYRPGGPSLFDAFRAAGYRTYGVSAQSEAWGNTAGILRMNELDRFHDVRNAKWDPAKLTGFQKRHGDLALFLDSSDVNKVVAEMIDEKPGKPFFMYVNFQDLHYPYFNESMPKVLTDEFHGEAAFFTPENRAAIVRQYRNAALHLDKGIAQLFRVLEQRGIAEQTVVVMVGDHPDSFFENGLTGHGWSLDQHQRRTPLVVVNGRGRWTLPIGQDEIARIVVESVNRGAEAGNATFTLDPAKRIFEVTNTLDAPRQIAWIGPGPDDLMTYDFKTDRWQPGTTQPWIRSADVTPASPSWPLFRALVNRWESARVARAAAITAAGGKPVPDVSGDR